MKAPQQLGHALVSQTGLEVRADCRHFRGDLPCIPNKERGRICNNCPEYQPWGKRVLVVKLDAMGDVLRTTCILGPLLQEFPGARVTWITAPPSVPLLQHLPQIAEVVPADHRAISVLGTESFDLVLGLDAGPLSGRLTSMARAAEHRGFGMSPRGAVTSLNTGADAWYKMGLFDNLKQANSETYQRLICQASGLAGSPGTPLYTVTAREKAAAADRAGRWGLREHAPIIGLNIGSGGRWPAKRWPLGHWKAAIAGILEKWPRAAVLLLGGPEEHAMLPELADAFPLGKVVNTGSDNSVRDFAAICQLCQIIVTGDTLALHIAQALGKRLVAMFGPTSAVEVEMYGLGEKLIPPGGCSCFYRKECTLGQPCLEHLNPSTVLEALERQMKLS